MATYSEAELVLHSSGDNIQDQTQEVQQMHDDVEMKSNGSSGTDSNGIEFSESSSSSASHNEKDSALLLDSLPSSKSSNSQSLSLHCSSNGFSLISASSEQDNPSTSGCSSDQSAKAKTQKELIKALAVLKRHLPSEKMTKGKSRTLSTLKYALDCVKQVQANEEYYRFLMNTDTESNSLSLNSFTVDEVENIISEYTSKNADIFAVTVSLITGQIVYISDQAASILNCNKEVFKSMKFTELLAPQDVGVFYSSTKPSQLPMWNVCTAAGSLPSDCMQEKSFFCRISGNQQQDHSTHYYPFRVTPYLTRVRASEDDDDQLCCLLLAERVHSGYEAPRIPHDKRVFTTTHTPSCMFQDIEERAVPLLGYLPQDLIGMPILMHLHPDDQPLMVAIHKKILKQAGQPFEHSPVRFCTQNGDYITIDTSWSSFVNPWSRKVSFIIGRHKVRTGPLNEDVFAVPESSEMKTLSPEIQTITEQIQQLLLQPIYNNGSSGYGCLGSNGSHTQIISVASSMDANGNINKENHWDKPITVQKICKDEHLGRIQGQTDFIEKPKSESKRRNKTGMQKELSSHTKDLKMSPSKGASINSAGKNMLLDEPRCKEHSGYCYQQINCLDSVMRYLDSYNILYSMKRKCNSSSPSDDDKQKVDKVDDSKAQFKPTKEMPSGAVVGTPLAPLTLPRKAASVISQGSYSSTIVHVGDKKQEILLEDGLVIADPTENVTPPALVTTASSVNPEKEPYKKLGLTKEVLAAHTQKEEQIFLSKFMELNKLKPVEASYKPSLQNHRKGFSGDRGSRGFKLAWNRGENAHKKGGRNRKPELKRSKQQGSSDSAASLNTNHRHPPWSPSAPLQQICPPLPITAVIPTYQLPMFSASGGMPFVTDPSLGNFESGPAVHCNPQPSPFPAPLVPPLVAVVWPNYVMPPVTETVHQPIFQPPLPSQPGFLPAQNSFHSQPQFPSQHHDQPARGEKMPTVESQGVRSCPGPPGHNPTPLFHSRSSSPLQLNLLDEMPTTSEAVGSVGAAGLIVDGGGIAITANVTNVDAIAKDEAELAEAPAEAQNSDAHSTSTDILDLLLHSDTRSAGSGSVGSSASGSSRSPSNGCGMSGTDTGSSYLSSSKYFGSSDSENEKVGQSNKFMHQNPIWLENANADERTMMTYQLPVRDIETVLKEDREKLKQMQRNQPKFTEKQKKELAEVFPWFKTNAMLKTIDITDNIFGEKNVSQSISPTFDAEVHNLELNGLMELGQDVAFHTSNFTTEEQTPSEISSANLELATYVFGNSAS
ncbi:period circadian protein homolog 2 [Hypanus sabinus]|uniref:period circadian protein homolog 2 n=1 Tax=Hypanus sabinus TaxID=79690 RepID=UPI0028C47CDA|nr:period circadian protein homolog 2 [Hypanus sabinus]XP_059804025.1 period circadian protein homolog 2 [Hypanus sabinus]